VAPGSFVVAIENYIDQYEGAWYDLAYVAALHLPTGALLLPPGVVTEATSCPGQPTMVSGLS
jgi:hypothetical protein